MTQNFLSIDFMDRPLKRDHSLKAAEQYFTVVMFLLLFVCLLVFFFFPVHNFGKFDNFGFCTLGSETVNVLQEHCKK